MNKRALVLALAGVAAAAGLVAARLREPKAEAAPFASSGPSRPAPADPNAVPVLVELFTSEGCSSCPPADAVLAALERTQPIAGARVVALGLHVDYWDRLGWTDPFSSARATERQRAYALLGGGSYTPQAVIDGRAETVGSRRGAVALAIAEAARSPHASLGVDVAPRANGKAPFEITLRIGALPPGSAHDAEVLVTLTQNAAHVVVRRGENAGLTLEHTAIAREILVVSPAAVQGGSLRATLEAPAGVPAKDLRVVAFVQERGSRHVLATATHDLADR